MLYVTLLLVAAAALMLLLVLLVRLVVVARRAAYAVQVARSALGEGTGLLGARTAALRVELDRRRGRTGDEPDDPPTA
ncbi:MAG: hypothetical protein GEU83_07670 [Pseudonocardiaceae bacterium]|nr:hypothetical protein [Pseudonocardiaceae bacterium]